MHTYRFTCGLSLAVHVPDSILTLSELPPLACVASISVGFQSEQRKPIFNSLAGPEMGASEKMER